MTDRTLRTISFQLWGCIAIGLAVVVLLAVVASWVWTPQLGDENLLRKTHLEIQESHQRTNTATQPFTENEKAELRELRRRTAVEAIESRD